MGQDDRLTDAEILEELSNQERDAAYPAKFLEGNALEFVEFPNSKKAIDEKSQ